MSEVLTRIQNVLTDARKHIKVTCNKWLFAIDNESRESLQLLYLKHLLYSLQTAGDLSHIIGSLPVPFDKHPPDGPLQRLPPHLTLKFKKHSKRNNATKINNSNNYNTTNNNTYNSTTLKSLSGRGGKPRTMRGGGGKTLTKSTQPTQPKPTYLRRGELVDGNDGNDNNNNYSVSSKSNSNSSKSNGNSTQHQNFSPGSPSRRPSQRPSQRPSRNQTTRNQHQNVSPSRNPLFFSQGANIADRINAMSRIELETQVYELTSTVETQRGRIDHLESELRIQQGMRKRGEERQNEMHTIELKQLNKEKDRELQRAAMEAVRHPAELLLEERMNMVVVSLEAEMKEEKENGDTKNSTRNQKYNNTDAVVTKVSSSSSSDLEFLEYLDQFTLRTQALSNNLL